MAMMAMTTSNSMSVNPRCAWRGNGLMRDPLEKKNGEVSIAGEIDR
jgi:hypothetical protein